MNNIVQTVMGALSPTLADRLASALGESPGAVTKGFSAAVPAVLAGAMQQSARPDGPAKLVDMIRQAMAGGNPLDRVAALAPDDAAQSIFLNHGEAQAKGLLGGQAQGVTQGLASFAGLKGGSAGALMALAAPMALGAIGKALGGALSPSGVQSLLTEQRSNITAALPAGLGGLFGLGGAAQAARGAAGSAAASGGAGLRRLWPWLIAAVVLIALFLLMRGCMGGAARRTATPPAAPAVTAPAAAVTEQLRLRGGSTISVAPGSIGYGVAKFLDSADPAPKTFVFDNLNFDTASNAITPASAATISTLATILKAYPNAQARIVGYTDNQGAPAANQTLSQRRAEAVASQMAAQGVAADRLQTAGMGEASPIADNATEDGRAKNRRTELEITRK